MINGNFLLCPFCGDYMSVVSDSQVANGECKACGTVLTKNSDDKPVIWMRSTCKKHVKDTFDFLTTVRENQYDFYFSKAKPFSEDFSFDAVRKVNKASIQKGSNVISHIKKDDLDLIAAGTLVAYNLNKQFTYSNMEAANIRISLAQFSCVGEYVFAQACLNTYISDEVLDRCMDDLAIACRLPFPDGMLVPLCLAGDTHLPKLSDEGLLFSLIFDSMPVADLATGRLTSNIVRDFLIRLSNNITDDFDPVPIGDFPDFANMKQNWRDQFLSAYCYANPELCINVKDEQHYSLYSIINKNCDLHYTREELSNGGVINEIGVLTFLSHYVNKYFSKYTPIVGYDYKVKFLTEHNIDVESSTTFNILNFWRTVNTLLKEKMK